MAEVIQRSDRKRKKKSKKRKKKQKQIFHSKQGAARASQTNTILKAIACCSRAHGGGLLHMVTREGCRLQYRQECVLAFFRTREVLLLSQLPALRTGCLVVVVVVVFCFYLFCSVVFFHSAVMPCDTRWLHRCVLFMPRRKCPSWGLARAGQRAMPWLRDSHQQRE